MFLTSNYSFLVLKKGVLFHPRDGYLKVRLQSYLKESDQQTIVYLM
jgi:hypothetical protein